MHVYTDLQLGNIFFNSVKLISMSTNSRRYWNKIKLNSRSSENGRSSGYKVLKNYMLILLGITCFAVGNASYSVGFPSAQIPADMMFSRTWLGKC